MTKHQQILNFITLIRESHPLMTTIYMEGSCFNFYLILKKVYLEAQPYHNTDHVITKIDKRFYDIRGEVKVINSTKDYVPLRNSRSVNQMLKYYNKEVKL